MGSKGYNNPLHCLHGTKQYWLEAWLYHQNISLQQYDDKLPIQTGIGI